MLQPVVLEGDSIRLVPLRTDHLPALHQLADREVFAHNLTGPEDDTFAAFATWMARFLDPGEGVVAFTVLDAASGEPIGVTVFLDYRARDRGIEIGATWYGAAARGTGVNLEAKWLLLRHAFEVLLLRRVQLKTSSENLRSQRAIEKLGAIREGVLRKFQARSNGLSRDTVMYSITDDEWPQVKARLERQLAEHRAAAGRAEDHAVAPFRRG